MASIRITVGKRTTGQKPSAVVRWVAPTNNTDGSPLTDLRKHKVYISKNGAAETSILVDMPMTACIIDNLDPAIYDVRVTAINSIAVESASSPQLTWQVIY